MNLIQLANKALSSHLTQANGYGEKVDYNHVEISVKMPDIVCSPQSGNFKHLNDERTKDAMSFFGLFLSNSPQKNDLISYNGVDWKVEMYDGINPYNIVAYRKSNVISRKQTR